MSSKILGVFLATLMVACAHQGGQRRQVAQSCPTSVSSMLSTSRQLLVVRGQSWSSPAAQLQFFERTSMDSPWKLVQSVPAVVGRNGMGWGKNFSELRQEDQVMKKEGDGKSPAGVFALGPRFGFAPSADRHHLQVTANTFCVDDSKSRYYNQIVDKSQTVKDWKDGTGENMAEEPLYKMGFAINYESDRVLQAGSCIFMHIWSDSTTGTAGCVAVPESAMEFFYTRLKPELKPLIAILPQEENWCLP